MKTIGCGWAGTVASKLYSDPNLFLVHPLVKQVTYWALMAEQSVSVYCSYFLIPITLSKIHYLELEK